MAVVSVPLSHRKAGSCEEDIGFSETAELCGRCRLPQWLHTQRTGLLFVMASNQVWSSSHTSISPVAHVVPFSLDVNRAGREACSARLNNCFQDKPSPQTMAGLIKLPGGGGASEAL